MSFTDSFLINLGRNFTNKASSGKESVQAIIVIVCIIYLAYRVIRRYRIKKNQKILSSKK